MDLRAEPDMPAKIHFVWYNCPAKSHLIQPIGLNQAKKFQQRVPEGQTSLMHATVLNTSNPFTKSPERCIAKSIPQGEHPTAGIRQSGYKQSPL